MTTRQSTLKLEIEPLAWDSDFFGLRIGRLRPHADTSIETDELRSIERSSFDCVYVELPITAASSLDHWITAGARLVDFRVELSAKTGERSATEESAAATPIAQMTYWTAVDRADATALAVDLSQWSRFRNDPRFVRSAERMYRGWVGLAFSGAHQALVWREGGRIAGLLTFKVDPAETWIELLAVDSHFRGRGIGTSLVNEFLVQGRRREAKVRTQLRNVGAVRTYERAGFALETTTMILHWWSR